MEDFFDNIDVILTIFFKYWYVIKTTLFGELADLVLFSTSISISILQQHTVCIT